MKFWHNPEIKKITFISLGITLGLFLLSFVFLPQYSFIILGLSLFWLVFFLLFQSKKYKQIERLNADLDRILFEQQYFSLDEYKEGEFSILAVNIEKILIQLKENRDNLLKDKNYLADHLADISHQLRTPLASLNLIIDRLKDDISSEEKRQLIHKMMLLSDRINRLIESLLLMSKLDAGAITFDLKTYPVQYIVDQVLNNVIINLEMKNIQIEADISGEVECDSFWLTEALTNIIKNCIEHSSNNARIQIKAQRNAFFSEIILRDYGTGILKQDLPHIFERFYRGENAAENSIGIGLALSKQLIQLQNGEIVVESVTAEDFLSQPNSKPTGTTFKIKFYSKII